jgi:type VII secretion-associated serine protease mycosin
MYRHCRQRARRVRRSAWRQVPACVAALALVLASAGPARADATRDRQWYLEALKVAEAQRITKGAGVIVAVLDTGVEAGHPDLKGAVLPGINTVREGAKGNADTEGHGTAMAGIIAARGRSGERGLIGIAPAAKILPIRPADDPIFAADGLRYAAANGAKVINMSFGIGSSDRLREAVQVALDADLVLVASAGNTGDTGDNVDNVDYPGGYPQVLTVGAIDRDGRVAKFSQHGPQVDIVAPGTGMYTAGLGDTYREGFGTSNAAAVVSGAAALIRARYPELTAAQVVERLTSTARDRGDPGRDDYYGHGELDLIGALTAPPPTASAAPRLTDAPAAVSVVSGGDEDRGIPPLVFVGIGLVLLVVALMAVMAAVRHSRRG